MLRMIRALRKAELGMNSLPKAFRILILGN